MASRIGRYARTKRDRHQHRRTRNQLWEQINNTGSVSMRDELIVIAQRNNMV